MPFPLSPPAPPRLQLLAVSGSLRAHSINSALLRVMTQLASPPTVVTVSQAIARLPLFNPDLGETPPRVVTRFYAEVDAADALIIASPEYAHGVTGTIKNALDWLVGFAPFAGKPVAVLNTSPRATHADAALRETLRTMAACLVEPASLSLALLGAGLDEEAMLASPLVRAFCHDVVDALRAFTQRCDAEAVPR